MRNPKSMNSSLIQTPNSKLSRRFPGVKTNSERHATWKSMRGGPKFNQVWNLFPLAHNYTLKYNKSKYNTLHGKPSEIELVLCLRCQVVPFHAHFRETHALGAIACQVCKAGDILTVHTNESVSLLIMKGTTLLVSVRAIPDWQRHGLKMLTGPSQDKKLLASIKITYLNIF